MTERPFLALGNFDGVHRGHQAILSAARRIAGSSPVIAVTFWPHPLTVLRPQRPPVLLMDLPDRIAGLRQAGADRVRVVEFTRRVAAWSAADFIDLVVAPYEPKTVAVGENFHFGHGAQADADSLDTLADGRFDLEIVPMVCDDGPISSSRVRRSVAAGDLMTARRLLGRSFRFSGAVVTGDRRGRTLGFPTANLVVPVGRACPPDGVYAGYLSGGSLGAEPRPAAISVGSNPTFDGHERRVETHVIDASDLDLYGQRVHVDFSAPLRGQVRFDGAESLIRQLKEDRRAALVALGRPVTPA
ncbi:MAG: riboflavin biosynthesis protein RibF [Propionibacteriaceae bacterium]|jgi:riboflavin kinase/FMN adenylyltransferase|nr:riboflavin biosynthesis protein RibF [Propionibacteriaceae bacterium]